MRNLLVGLVAGLMVGAGPVSAGVNLYCLDDPQKQIAQDVLREHSFDWSQLATRVKVQVAEIGAYQAIGLTWPDGRIQIDDDYLDRFDEIFRHELGHVVDFFYLTPYKRAKIEGWVGHEWREISEDWPDLFTAAFTTEQVEATHFEITPELIRKTRRLVTP